PKTGLFSVARHENGALTPAHLDVWYPDTVAQAWPLLFGVLSDRPETARATMALVNDTWDGEPKPDWTRNVVDPGGFTWPPIASAARPVRWVPNLCPIPGRRSRSKASRGRAGWRSTGNRSRSGRS